jgi:hypothetical protein
VKSLSRAVGRLPVRWQRALWLTEVEGHEPAELAALLGVPEAGAAALARRAREGLRLAYLLVQLRPGMPAECRRTVDRLPAYARTALPLAVAEQVMDHLEACAFCRARSREYAELTEDLRGPLRPVLFGDDIRQPVPVPAPMPAPMPASGRAAEVPAPRRRRPAVAAGCVAVALVAVASVAVVSLRPDRTPSQGSSPSAAAVGVPSATARPDGSASSARSTKAGSRVESATPGSARAGNPRPAQRARVSASRSAAAPGGGGMPPASTVPVPEPEPTIAPSSEPRKVCVGVLVVRLCRGVG